MRPSSGPRCCSGRPPWCCGYSSTGGRASARHGIIRDVAVRPLPTVAIGVVGGFVVGMTSVGSGSLMIVLLLFLYPVLGANQLVGTDLTQAVPLTLAAALGALGLRARRVLRDDLDHHRERPGRLRRRAPLLAGPGPLHPARSSPSSSSPRASSTSASAPPRWAGRSAPCCWPAPSTGSSTCARSCRRRDRLRQSVAIRAGRGRPEIGARGRTRDLTRRRPARTPPA